MATYEMPLLLKLANKAEYATVLKNVAKAIFDTGGFIRKIENWGDKELPCKAIAHGQTHKRAGHFMLCFDVPPPKLELVIDHCRRHLHIIRADVYKQNVPEENVECTLHEEMLPPPYRPSVQKLIEAEKMQKKPKNKYKNIIGLGYYPFMR